MVRAETTLKAWLEGASSRGTYCRGKVGATSVKRTEKGACV